MLKIKVHLRKQADRSHEILIGNSILPRIGTLLRKSFPSRKYAIISDSNVSRLYGKKVLEIIRKEGIDADLFTFKAGEKSKNIETVEMLLEKLLKHGFTRKDAIIALGGGVTGDLAGFAASIYMRGIPFIQVPTTLIGMVDSSIGGKTGINLTEGKNLCGTFYQPELILIDPFLVKTLPKEEYLNGFAEIIKYGITLDDKLFCLLEKSAKNILSKDFKILSKIIAQCCKIKASIIEKYEKESNLRMVLNYGHTVGHAIERLSKYKISHGQAISMGMQSVNNLAVSINLQTNSSRERIKLLLNRYNLPTDILRFFNRNNLPLKLWKIMQNDKKMHKSKINFIIAKTIGKTMFYDKITKHDFIKSFK